MQDNELFKLKSSYLKEAKSAFYKEVFAQIINEGLEITMLETDDDFLKTSYIAVNNVPVRIDNVWGTGNDCYFSFNVEDFWFKKIKNLSKLQIDLLKTLDGNAEYTSVKQLCDRIKRFFKENPIYNSKKLLKTDKRLGVFENIQTFENWKDSEKLVKTNKNTGIFEEEKEDGDTQMINGVLVNYAEETCTIQGEDGELKIGAVYEEDGTPSHDCISISCETTASGFLTIKVADLQKLIKIAEQNLDNMPEIS